MGCDSLVYIVKLWKFGGNVLQFPNYIGRSFLYLTQVISSPFHIHSTPTNCAFNFSVICYALGEKVNRCSEYAIGVFKNVLID